LFGLQRAVTYCAFGLGALSLNRSVAFGLLRPFGLTSFLFRPFDLAGGLDRTALGRARRSLRQPFCQRRVSNLGAKLFNATFRALAAASWRCMKSGCLKPAIYFRPCVSMLHGLPWLGGLSCVRLPSTHAPSDHPRFDWSAGLHTVPSTATPSAQKRNDIGADVILAKKFKRLVRRRVTLVSERVYSLLPCRHTVSIGPVVSGR
jgi:hypothetical protein